MKESFATPLLLALLFVGVTLGISSATVSERTQLASVSGSSATEATSATTNTIDGVGVVTTGTIAVSFNASSPSTGVDCQSGAPMRSVMFYVQPTGGGYFSIYRAGGGDMGDKEPGTYAFPAGTYSWEGKARAGYVRAGTYTGSFTIEGTCATADTTPHTTTTSTNTTTIATTPPPVQPTPTLSTLRSAIVTVSVGSTCTLEKGMTQVAISVEPQGSATVSFRKENGNMITSASQGIVYLPNGTYSWKGEAKDGYQISGISSGTLTLASCPVRLVPSVAIGGSCDPVEEGVPLTYTLGGEGKAYLSLTNTLTKETVPLQPGVEYVPNGSYTWNIVSGSAIPAIFDGSTSGNFTVSACKGASLAPYTPPKAGTILFFREGKLVDPIVRQGEKIAVRVDLSGVSAVELERVGKDTREVLGKMTKDDGTTRWLFAWSVGDIDPGEYDLLARATGPKGESVSGSRIVEVLPSLHARATLPTTTPSPPELPEELSPLGDVPVPEEPLFDRLAKSMNDEDTHLGLPVRGVADLISTVDILAARNTLPDVVRSPQDLRIFCATEANDDVCFEFLPEALRKEAQEAVEESRKEMSRAFNDRPDVALDADKDGVSDFDETHFYGTDPEKADSDGDGKSDQRELESLDDPLRETKEVASVLFEDPSFGGEERADLFAVTDVRAGVSTDVSTEGAPPSGVPVILAGKALPNALVTLYIYSDPIIVRVKADENGLWSYTLTRELPDGSHKAYVAMTDSAGRVLAKSAPLPFVKEAAAVSVVSGGLSGTTPAAPGLFSGTSLYAIIAIMFGVIGFAIIAVGIVVRSRKNDSVIP